MWTREPWPLRAQGSSLSERFELVMFSKEFREFRAKVRPGITGLWRVLERNNGDIGTQETLDTYYVRSWSLWLDLYILILTFSAVLSWSGAR